MPVCPPDQAYVPPAIEPVATSVAELPVQMVWLVDVTTGVGFTVTLFVCVTVLLPAPFVAVIDTEYVPAVAYVTTGLADVEVDGVPPGKLQE